MKVIDFFKKLNISSSSDVEFAMAHLLHKKRSEILFCEINKTEQKSFLKIYKQLLKNKPLDLILGKANFYGYDFYVNKHVLKPRQDTECVCEEAIRHIKASDKVLDLCCGSGAIGITLAKETGCSVTLSDVSQKALKICKKNVKLNNINAKVIKSDLFAKINEKFDVIVSNPPYIKKAVINKLDENVKKYDPIIALDGGKDGLDFYKRIIKDAPKFLNEGGELIFEIGFDQAQKVLRLMGKQFKAYALKDYNNKDRIIIGEYYGKTR